MLGQNAVGNGRNYFGYVSEICSSPLFRERGWRSTSQHELTQVAVIVLIVIRTIRLIGSDANGVFPYALSSLPGEPCLPQPFSTRSHLLAFVIRHMSHVTCRARRPAPSLRIATSPLVAEWLLVHKTKDQ